MTWATVADATTIGLTVAAVPGVTTTPEGTILLAQQMVEEACGRTEAAEDSFSLRDLGHLKKAVIWQAVWLPSQPGILGRMGASTVSQDGLSTTFNSPVDVWLAPLAQRALKSLTWMNTRSIRTRTRAALPDDPGGVPVTAGSFLHSGADPEEGWCPL